MKASLVTATAPGLALGEPVVAATGIVRRWPRQSEPVLRGVDLTVPAGAAVAVTGRNGAGKTTLLRILGGLIAPDAGTVRLSGLDPEHDRREYQRRIGYLPAGDRGLYARLSVRRHLEYWACLALLPRARRASAVAVALSHFALEDLATRRVDRLSMGQRQRVRLALTFLHDPEVVLLDEPGNSLDEDGRALLLDALTRLLGGGGAVVWCAPAGEALPELTTRVGTIEDGELRW